MLRPKTPTKDQEYYHNYYQLNKDKKKQQQRDNYHRKQAQEAREKAQREKETLELAPSLYHAHNIKILLDFKTYTELTRGKQAWLNFTNTLQNLHDQGADLVSIMRLEQAAHNLIQDYNITAKQAGGIKRRWNQLSQEKQNRLLKYWARERILDDETLNGKFQAWDRKAEREEKALEMLKYHEERGKIKCQCWQCQAEKRATQSAQATADEYFTEPESHEERTEVLSDCGQCGENKRVDVESGLCRKCERESDEAD